MDYDMNAPCEEGLQQYAAPQYQDEGYTAPLYKKPWLWISAAAVLAAAGVIAILLAPGPAPERFELTGNAGVVAAYDFFCSQQDSQDKLTSPVIKELGERLKEEPFEIECTVNMDSGSQSESLLPLNNIGIGIYAKYDLKDFGLRLGSMGLDVISAYLIEDDFVVTLMGRTGSAPVKKPEGVNIKQDMGFDERMKAIFPFIPDDEVYLSLLEKFAHSVPDKYTTEGTAKGYSPKDEKEADMDIITTALDSQALREVILNFAGEVKSDKKFFRQLQNIADDFTDFAGLEKQDLSGLIEELESSAGTQALADIELSWSVFRRDGSPAGISIGIYAESSGFDYKYTYMQEYEGSDNYVYALTELNGAKQETRYKYSWQDSRMKISGEVKTTSSVRTGSNTTQLIEGEIEFSKNGENEYAITGDVTMNGNVYNDMFNSPGGVSVNMKIDVSAKVGSGLKTLKEDRKWKGVYDREWGSMEDVFGSLFPGIPDYSYYDEDTAITFKGHR